MKGLKKAFILFLIISMVIGTIYSTGWAQDYGRNDQYNILDLLVARPLGVVAAAIGTCVFIVSLPFTLPTRSVDDSFYMFVVEPWKFSYVREFPDENI